MQTTVSTCSNIVKILSVFSHVFPTFNQNNNYHETFLFILDQKRKGGHKGAKTNSERKSGDFKFL